MASTIMDPAATPQAADTRPEKSVVDAIIDRARSAPAPARGALTVSLATAALLWAAFTPLDWGPLGWVCLVPLILLIRIDQPTRWMYGMIYLGGLAFSLVALQWMRLGDVWMYPAWIALAVYVALYFPVFVGISRIAVHRFRIPLPVAVPVVWVGLEFLRAHLLSGFAWYFLGHTQYRWNILIQISDLFGAYAVSFLVALGNAVVAQMIGGRWLAQLRLLPADAPADVSRYVSSYRQRMVSIAALLVLVSVALVYGVARRAQARFAAGPRVALIQGDYPSSLKHDPAVIDSMYNMHRRLTISAVEEQPDLIVWPETMFPSPVLELDGGLDAEGLTSQHPELSQLPEADDRSRNALQSFAEECGATLIIGLEAFAASPDAVHRYNSALLVDRQRGISGRYDKIHRVPFGEYIPFADSFQWIQRMFPFAQEMGIAAGEKVHVFTVDGYRLVPMICFEDTVPHLAAEMVTSAETGGRPVACLVNLTNDGWFAGSCEQEQHLITASFRCLETRTAMIRAVNTGISAIIDNDGLVRKPEVFISMDDERATDHDANKGALPKDVNCALVGYVPIDNRASLYARWGDWFAGACAVGCLLLVVLRAFVRNPVAAETIAA